SPPSRSTGMRRPNGPRRAMNVSYSHFTHWLLAASGVSTTSRTRLLSRPSPSWLTKLRPSFSSRSSRYTSRPRRFSRSPNCRTHALSDEACERKMSKVARGSPALMGHFLLGTERKTVLPTRSQSANVPGPALRGQQIHLHAPPYDTILCFVQ